MHMMHLKEIGARCEQVLPEFFLPRAGFAHGVTAQCGSPVFVCTRSSLCSPALPELLVSVKSSAIPDEGSDLSHAAVDDVGS